MRTLYLSKLHPTILNKNYSNLCDWMDNENVENIVDDIRVYGVNVIYDQSDLYDHWNSIRTNQTVINKLNENSISK